MDSEIVILGMGGTIAGRASSRGDNVGYTAGEVSVQALVAQCLQGVVTPAGTTFICEQVAQKDSKDMQFDDWHGLAERISYHLARPQVQGVVVTHGTDTVEEAACFLHLCLAHAQQSAKPVVLTCAMRPSTSLAPDGPQNLRDAVTVALNGRRRGVMVVCAAEIHAAMRVRKTHTYSTQAFASVGGGVLGYVEEGAVRWALPLAADLEPEAGQFWRNAAPARWPRVEIILSHADACGDLVEALLHYPGKRGLVDGLVVAGTGNGTVHSALESALLRAREAGVRVVRVSRCADGAVLGEGSGIPSLRCGTVLSPFQARIMLMLELSGTA